MTLSEEIRNALEDKNDLIMQGIPLARDGKPGDIRTNIFNKGKTYMAMKASQDQWVFSMAFTEQMSSNRLEDYLLLSGGKMHDNSKIDAYDVTVRNNLILSSLDVGHIPYIGAAGLVSTDNGQLFWDAANNRLGIGDPAPDEIVHIKGTNSGGIVAIHLQNSTTGAGSEEAIIFTTTTNDDFNSGEIRSGRGNDLRFHTNNGATPRMVIDNVGNVGTWTITPPS